jgi:hypothetical protein
MRSRPHMSVLPATPNSDPSSPPKHCTPTATAAFPGHVSTNLNPFQYFGSAAWGSCFRQVGQSRQPSLQLPHARLLEPLPATQQCSVELACGCVPQHVSARPRAWPVAPPADAAAGHTTAASNSSTPPSQAHTALRVNSPASDEATLCQRRPAARPKLQNKSQVQSVFAASAPATQSHGRTVTYAVHVSPSTTSSPA